MTYRKIKDKRTHIERSYRAIFVISLNKKFEKYLEACDKLDISSFSASLKYTHYILDAITQQQKEINNNKKESERKQTNFFLVHLNRCFVESESYEDLKINYKKAVKAYLDNESEYFWNKKLS